MGTITMYAHHVLHDPSAMADGEDVDEQLRALGHDWSEEWFFSEDMQHALVIAEFGSSKDVVTHFNALEESGFSEMLATVFSITHADFIGDLDDEARTLLGKYDFVRFLSAPPEG